MLDLAAVVQQIDTYFSQNRGPEAEQLMKESIVQAVREEDDQALLTLLNELIGYYRETSQVEASYRLADQALSLLSQMGLEGTIPYATTLLNIANAYRAGGRLDDSLSCYEQTAKLYRQLLDPKDMLTASLYNNMSLLYQEMGRFAEAKQSLLNALEIVSCHEDAYFELAVTYTNLAATCLTLNEDEEASGHFQKAIAIFEAHGIEDAHYSAALSSLGTYYYKRGSFAQAAENFRKAMECMRKSLGENEYYHRLKENLAACEQAIQEADKEAVHASAADSRIKAEAGNGKDSCNAGQSQEESMSGMELCRKYYEAYGKPMIHELFEAYEDKIAAGLAGEGSDCFGYDDAVSRDHDWGPDFCLWLTEETYGEIGERLQEAYEKLPVEFLGYKRTISPQGRGRRGVQTINGFFGRLLGKADWEGCFGTLSDEFWQQASDAALAASVNGEVFCDPQGIFSAVRSVLAKGYPERMQYLKLAEGCAVFSQTGQYNYARMSGRGDQLTAQIMLGDCLKEAAKLCYYMENQYPPHDKWLVKGLRQLGGYQEVAELMEKVLGEQKTSQSERVSAALDALAAQLVHRLYRAGFISDTDSYLELHAPELLKKAQYGGQSDQELADLIAKMEFSAFDKVRNVGGRADCQDDWFTFSIMRKSQYLTWNRTMLLQYLYDFDRELSVGHNLIEEKYGRMMESTAPEEYERIKEHFPALSQEKKEIIEAIVGMQVGWMEEFEKHYPTLAGNARSIHTREDNLYNTSYETYLRGEISTYSDKMLELYGRYVVEYAQRGENLTYAIMNNSVEMYGYHSLEEAEEQMSRLRI